MNQQKERLTMNFQFHSEPIEPVVLLVDDNKEITEFLSQTLESQYAVLTASNGVEALSVLNAETVHLVVSDIMMHVMDGFELCRYKNQFYSLPHPRNFANSKKNTRSKNYGP